MSGKHHPILSPLSTAVKSEQQYTEEETKVLRAILAKCKAERRTNLTTIELFRLLKDIGYRKQ